MWKNVHPVCGAWIQTHNLLNVSLLPLPLDYTDIIIEVDKCEQSSHLLICFSQRFRWAKKLQYNYQYDHMAKLFFKYLAINNKESLPNNKTFLPQYDQNFT